MRATTTAERRVGRTDERVPVSRMPQPSGRFASLPITRELTFAYVLTLTVAVLVAGVSVVGLVLGPTGLYTVDTKVAAGVTASTAGVLVPGFL
ncbi:MAG: hypothetical protein ACYC7H_02410, partial [Chloroflexota bacterium]